MLSCNRTMFGCCNFLHIRASRSNFWKSMRFFYKIRHFNASKPSFIAMKAARAWKMEHKKSISFYFKLFVKTKATRYTGTHLLFTKNKTKMKKKSNNVYRSVTEDMISVHNGTFSIQSIKYFFFFVLFLCYNSPNLGVYV